MIKKAILIISTLCVINTSLLADASPAEKNALIDFYNSTDGDNWTNNTNWTEGDPCNNHWRGVTCNVGHDVTELHLTFNSLSGEIPNSIGDLVHLTFLSLYSNTLSGEIPNSIGDLVHLQELYLGTNTLSGQIPDSIRNLGDLSILDLSHNNLSGEIPTAIGSLVDLFFLGLNNNNLSGQIPSEILNITAFTDSDFRENSLINNDPSIETWLNQHHATSDGNSGSQTFYTGQVLAAPSNLNIVANSSTTVTLTWNDNSHDETGFKIFQDAAAIPLVTTSANQTSYQVTGLTPNTTYTFTLKATND